MAQTSLRSTDSGVVHHCHRHTTHHLATLTTKFLRASCFGRKCMENADVTAIPETREWWSNVVVDERRPSLTGLPGPLMDRDMNAILPSRDRRVIVDMAILVAFVAACYGLRMDKLSIRGEESRWATVAMEMQRTGDWIVPRQPGEPFLRRPPMGSWLIAAAASGRGAFDPIAVRLPSILAVLAMTLLIYCYGRSFLGGPAALAAAVGFAAMPEVLQMGRLAESDAVFTFF